MEAAAATPIKGDGGRSPLKANARAVRRQSLNGIQTSGLSLIGKPSDSGKSKLSTEAL